MSEQEERKIRLNRSLRKRAKAFGLSRDVAMVLSSLLVFFGFLSYIGLPVNFVVAIGTCVVLTAMWELKDGMGEKLAAIRKPKQFTRGGFYYRSPLDLTRGKSNGKTAKTAKIS